MSRVKFLNLSINNFTIDTDNQLIKLHRPSHAQKSNISSANELKINEQKPKIKAWLVNNNSIKNVFEISL
jgi:hypothetical protein